MQNRLFVGNLSFNTTEDSVRSLFMQHGTVAKVTVVTDRDTGRPRGFAFVEMGSDAEAAAAIQATDGQNLDGRPLRVNVAEPRESRGGSGGGGRGGFGGGGRGGSRGGRDRY